MITVEKDKTEREEMMNNTEQTFDLFCTFFLYSDIIVSTEEIIITETGFIKEFFLENAVEYFVLYYSFKLNGMLKRPFYPCFPYDLDRKTRFGQNDTKRICDLNSCNGDNYRK